jgi:REP element-mobilizing transposase RayT
MPNQVSQLGIQFPVGHGGRRKHAGRKRASGAKPRVGHKTRPALDKRLPVHITKRVLPRVTNLRRRTLIATLRKAFVYGCRHGEFRICQFSIQGNHIHLICEAADRMALARGIQGWAIRVARGVNRACGDTGRVFDDRYHVEVLRSPVGGAIVLGLQEFPVVATGSWVMELGIRVPE